MNLKKSIAVGGAKNVKMDMEAHTLSFDCHINFKKKLKVGEKEMPEEYGHTRIGVSLDLNNPEQVQEEIAKYPFLQGFIETLVAQMGEEYK